MGTKVTIIGAGSVGAAIAYTMSQQTEVSEIVLIDIDQNKAEGEVLDIEQGTCFRSPITLVAGGYPDAVNSDVVILTSGVARKPGQTRIELTETNAKIVKSIAPEIARYAPQAKYIVVSNPVDIMTYVFLKASGLPEAQVLGTGTILDTARLRHGLSERLGIAQNNIHAYVFGEHGDHSFIPWSASYAAGQTLEQFLCLKCDREHPRIEIDPEEMLQYVRTSGSTVIRKKGATYYAIAQSVRKLCEMMQSARPSVTTVSTMLHGEYGIEGVCLSMLVMLGPTGVEGRVAISLTEQEQKKMEQSAEKLSEVIRELKL